MIAFTTACGRLLPVTLLALAVGCQQRVESNDAEATPLPQAEQSHADQSTVIRAVAEEPIKEPTETPQPEILSAPLESEVLADEGEENAGVFIID